MERSKAEEVCSNINVTATKDKCFVQILDFLRSGHHCGGGEVEEANMGNEASLTWLDVKPVNRQVSNPTFFSNFKLTSVSYRLHRIWPTLGILLEDQTFRTGRVLRVKKTMQKRMKTQYGSATEAAEDKLVALVLFWQCRNKAVITNTGLKLDEFV